MGTDDLRGRGPALSEYGQQVQLDASKRL